jgi:lipopolysaccharide biosynthesis glycosyltransferase
MTYNTNTVKGIESVDGDKLLTVGGAPPIVLHFANTKPWNIKKDDLMWRFANLCKNGTEQRHQQHLRHAGANQRKGLWAWIG